jgi:transposase
MKGKPISEDVGWIVINMNAKGLSASQISDYTMVSIRQVYRILHRHGATGGVVTSHEVETRGRSRKLLLADLEACGYMHVFLSHTDVFLYYSSS